MKIIITHNNDTYEVDLDKGHSIAIPLVSDSIGPKCFFAPPFTIRPVVAGDFIGDTNQGSPVNFKNITLNPHGNGTHTECVGHITQHPYHIVDTMASHHSIAKLISVPLILSNDDLIIDTQALIDALGDVQHCECLILRTLPNDDSKRTKDYSGTNPPFMTIDAIKFINGLGVKHLMLDLPSVDREEDGGALNGHKTYWGVPDDIQTNKTITEMVYIPEEIKDDFYFCNMQVLPIAMDASPSNILLYEMNKI